MTMFFPYFTINNKLHPCCCNLNMTEEINGKIAYWRFYLPVIHSCVIYDIDFMWHYCSLQPPLPHCESIKFLHWFLHHWTKYYDIIDDMYILTPGLNSINGFISKYSHCLEKSNGIFCYIELIKNGKCKYRLSVIEKLFMYRSFYKWRSCKDGLIRHLVNQAAIIMEWIEKDTLSLWRLVPVYTDSKIR